MISQLTPLLSCTSPTFVKRCSIYYTLYLLDCKYSCAEVVVSVQVSSTVELMREGRCALHTRLAVYKFLIAYGLHFSVLNIACYWYVPLLVCLTVHSDFSL